MSVIVTDPEFTEDDFAYPAMIQLAACLCQEIRDRGLPEPCLCGIVEGDVIPADFDCAGSATVRLVSIQLADYSDANATVVRQNRCVTVLEAELELAILRPAKISEDPLTTEEHHNETRLQLADMRALYATATCCFDDRPEIIGPYVPVGPEGGVVGGAIRLTISQLV